MSGVKWKSTVPRECAPNLAEFAMTCTVYSTMFKRTTMEDRGLNAQICETCRFSSGVFGQDLM